MLYRNPVHENIEQNQACAFHSRLRVLITRFEDSLDPDYEVGVQFVSFGHTQTFHLFDLDYANPSLITFSGVTEDGDPVELIQHVSRISVLLMKLPRMDPAQPKRKVEFG